MTKVQTCLFIKDLRLSDVIIENYHFLLFSQKFSNCYFGTGETQQYTERVLKLPKPQSRRSPEAIILVPEYFYFETSVFLDNILIRAFSDFKAFLYISIGGLLKPPIGIYKKALKSEKAQIYNIPADTLHCKDVLLTSMRRNDVASTSVRCHFSVMCPLDRS